MSAGQLSEKELGDFGFNANLPKPFALAQLVNAVNAALT
jgi:DNA-binding response OmpR family regulator